MKYPRGLVHRGPGRRLLQATIAAVLVTATLPLFQGAASALPGDIHTYAGTGTAGYSGDGGGATSAQVNAAWDVAADNAGNLFIADTSNNRIRKVSVTGVITTVVGTGVAGSSGDGGPAANAQLTIPYGVAFDSSGNLYIADTGNNRVRKVDVVTGTISNFAGNGTCSFSGDGAPATGAALCVPFGVAVDAVGNVYIGDRNNDRVRKVDTLGTISTVVGTGIAGYNGDGITAVTAQLNNPYGVAVDQSDNLYIADAVNNRIRKVDASGVITTVAGTGVGGYSGDGGPATSARVNGPRGLTVDGANNIYIADYFNARVRQVNAVGTITTVAGGGFSGDGGPARNASLNAPTGVRLDAAGNLYIADTGASRIRRVDGPILPQLPLPSAPIYASDDCDATGTNIVTGFVDGAYLKAKTASAGATSNVCLAVETAGIHVGGKLAVGVNVPALPVGVDLDPASVAACSTNANNTRIDSGIIAGEPWWIDLTLSPAGSTDAAWVCLRLTNSVGLRLRVGAVPGLGTIGFTPDPLSAHVPPYVENGWPVSGVPSAACFAAPSGKTRIINATVSSTPVAVYEWQETLARAHLCFRVGAAGGVGGELTIDGAAPLGVIATTNSTAPCPFTVFSSTSPDFGVFTSNPGAVPLSACVSVLGTALGVAINPSGGGSVASLILDPA